VQRGCVGRTIAGVARPRAVAGSPSKNPIQWTISGERENGCCRETFDSVGLKKRRRFQPALQANGKNTSTDSAAARFRSRFRPALSVPPSISIVDRRNDFPWPLLEGGTFLRLSRPSDERDEGTVEGCGLFIARNSLDGGLTYA